MLFRRSSSAVAHAVREPTGNEPVMSLRGVEKSFPAGAGQTFVLRRVTLDIRAGEFVSIMGPSGAGKSTLLHIAGLLEHPDRGDVYIDGRATAILPDHERTRIRRNEIGFIYQSHHLLPEFTALENVLLPQMIRGLTRNEANKRALELLSYLGLGERLSHRPAELSGGEQQRVALARAVIARPALVLADEPTGDLDSESAEIVLDLMWSLNRDLGATFVIATHNPRLESHATQVIELTNGRMTPPAPQT